MHELIDQWLGLAYNLPVYIAFAFSVSVISTGYLIATWIMRSLATIYIVRTVKRIKRAKAERYQSIAVATHQFWQRKQLKCWFGQILQAVKQRVSNLDQYRRDAYAKGFARLKSKADWAEFEEGYGNWCRLETRVLALRSECAGTFITPERINAVSGLWFAIHAYGNRGTYVVLGLWELDRDDYEPWRTDRVEQYIRHHLHV